MQIRRMHNVLHLDLSYLSCRVEFDRPLSRHHMHLPWSVHLPLAWVAERRMNINKKEKKKNQGEKWGGGSHV